MNPYHMQSFDLTTDFIIAYYLLRESQFWEKHMKILTPILVNYMKNVEAIIPVPNQDKCIQIEMETLAKNLPHTSLDSSHLVNKSWISEYSSIEQENLCPGKISFG